MKEYLNEEFSEEDTDKEAEENFGNCSVSEVGKQQGRTRALKIELPTEDLARRMTTEGISLSMNEKVSVFDKVMNISCLRSTHRICLFYLGISI